MLSLPSYVSTPLASTQGSLIKTHFWVIYLHETGAENRDASDKESSAVTVMHVISRQKLYKIIVNYKERTSIFGAGLYIIPAYIIYIHTYNKF